MTRANKRTNISDVEKQNSRKDYGEQREVLKNKIRKAKKEHGMKYARTWRTIYGGNAYKIVCKKILPRIIHSEMERIKVFEKLLPSDEVK